MSAEECWAPVPGHDGWTDVSNLGRVRRWYRYEASGRRIVWLDGPVVVPVGVCAGYQRVTLQSAVNGPIHSEPLHRLVLKAHVGPCPDGYIACHFPNKDPGCAELSTLRWDTRVANVEDDRVHRTCDETLILERLLALRASHPHLRDNIAGLVFDRPRKFVPHLDNKYARRSA